jgi:hypothetical protein
MKRNLTEEKLIELGFEKIIVPVEESLDDYEYYYFTYELFDNECLMTIQSSDEADDGLYDVSFFHMESAPKYSTSKQVQDLINAIKSVENV